MWMVVGLGNPGKKYTQTRHNVGFLAVEKLAERCGARVDRNQFKALVDKAQLADQDVLMVMPQTFMNLSGFSVSSLRGYFKIDVDHIVVIHDDMDLERGAVRVKRGGGHGGHNGLRDIQAKLGTNDFLRVRVGVGRPPSGWNPADYVLGQWSADESSALDQVLDRVADATEKVLSDGVVAAMNTFNTRPKAPRSKQPKPDASAASAAGE